MSKSISFSGSKATTNDILKTIETLGSYPIIEYNDVDFSIRVMPTAHHKNDYGIGFQINNGSLSIEKPQMTCFTLSHKAKIIEVNNKELLKKITLMNVEKAFFVKSSKENKYLILSFPSHLTKDGDIPEKGRFISKQIKGE
ncbi:MAG: hypothetical protein ACOCRK_05385 [bacterium]